MGADNLRSFHRWERWETILEQVPVGVLARPGEQVRAGLSPAARRFARWRVPQRRRRCCPDEAAGLDAALRAHARPLLDRAARRREVAAVMPVGRRRCWPAAPPGWWRPPPRGLPAFARRHPGALGARGADRLRARRARRPDRRGAPGGRPPAAGLGREGRHRALRARGARPRLPVPHRAPAAGPIEAGVLRGDLALVGGGDPLLDTDALGDLARALAVAGLRRVEGGFRVSGDALPAIAEVAGAQPADAGYNPTISGLNLNFNRVFIEWSQGASGPSSGSARPGVRHAAPVADIGAELAESGPARHRFEAGREVWTLARRRVRGAGSEWLPVRAPLAYAGEVFGGLAAQAGIALPPAAPGTAAGAVLALHDSPPLERMMRDMLFYSTNLTAEVAGLRAAQAQGLAPVALADSGAAMTAWARRRLGLSQAVFVNHSGLGDASRLPAREMTDALGRAAERLPALLRARPILDAERRPIEIGGAGVLAKTGTLDFVSALAGYLTGRRRLAFAIFAADPGARARIRPEERAAPPGAAAWAARARAQEQALLRRWATLLRGVTLRRR